MKKLKIFVIIITLTIACQQLLLKAEKKSTQNNWPKRVLITNDNGIDDIKIIQLARAFSRVTETYVVAPLTDRSGTGNYMSLGTKKPFVEVERRDLGPGIVAFALDGYPADCIYFAACGLLKDTPPDLVVSGINGGPNLGSDWMNSGTVGAARMAAFGGFPAIAVSGLATHIPGSVKAATQWIVEFSQSPLVKNLKNGQYLTISIPRVPPNEIKGIKIVPRAAFQISKVPTFVLDKKTTQSQQRQVWQLRPPAENQTPTKPQGDIPAYHENYIAIVPMNVDEVDYDFIAELQDREIIFPSWQVPGVPPAKNKKKK